MSVMMSLVNENGINAFGKLGLLPPPLWGGPGEGVMCLVTSVRQSHDPHPQPSPQGGSTPSALHCSASTRSDHFSTSARVRLAKKSGYVESRFSRCARSRGRAWAPRGSKNRSIRSLRSMKIDRGARAFHGFGCIMLHGQFGQPSHSQARFARPHCIPSGVDAV
jgi:hypothetical protein